MGKLTGNVVRVTKGTGYGSDHYGPCELCGKHMSEAFTSRMAREWVRDDGSLYLDHASPKVFAHEACIVDHFK